MLRSVYRIMMSLCDVVESLSCNAKAVRDAENGMLICDCVLGKEAVGDHGYCATCVEYLRLYYIFYEMDMKGDLNARGRPRTYSGPTLWQLEKFMLARYQAHELTNVVRHEEIHRLYEQLHLFFSRRM
jgi:hypothetical protein